MALIKCANCGKEVSDAIDTCIHCGKSIKKKEINTKITKKRIKIKLNIS